MPENPVAEAERAADRVILEDFCRALRSCDTSEDDFGRPYLALYVWEAEPVQEAIERVLERWDR